MVATGVLYLIASGFASNGISEHSPGGYSLQSAVMIERVPTAFLLIVIQGGFDKKAPAGFAPVAIGLALTLIHFITIPVTNALVNPTRSTAVALFQGTWAQQLWLFWRGPIAGGCIGGLIYRFLLRCRVKINYFQPCGQSKPRYLARFFIR